MSPNLVMQHLPASIIPCDVCVKAGKVRLSTERLTISETKRWYLCESHAQTVRRSLIITGNPAPDTRP